MSLAGDNASFVVACGIAAVLFSSLGWHLSEQHSKYILFELYHDLSERCCLSRASTSYRISTTTTTPSPEALQYDFWWWFKFAMPLGGVLSGLCFSCIGYVFFRVVAGPNYDGTSSPAESRKAIVRTAAASMQQLQGRDHRDFRSTARARSRAAGPLILAAGPHKGDCRYDTCQASDHPDSRRS